MCHLFHSIQLYLIWLHTCCWATFVDMGLNHSTSWTLLGRSRPLYDDILSNWIVVLCTIFHKWIIFIRYNISVFVGADTCLSFLYRPLKMCTSSRERPFGLFWNTQTGFSPTSSSWRCCWSGSPTVLSSISPTPGAGWTSSLWTYVYSENTAK